MEKSLASIHKSSFLCKNIAHSPSCQDFADRPDTAVCLQWFKFSLSSRALLTLYRPSFPVAWLTNSQTFLLPLRIFHFPPPFREAAAVKCEKFHFVWITSFILANRHRNAHTHTSTGTHTNSHTHTGAETLAQDNHPGRQPLSIARWANAFSTRFECAANQSTPTSLLSSPKKENQWKCLPRSQCTWLPGRQDSRLGQQRHVRADVALSMVDGGKITRICYTKC